MADLVRRVKHINGHAIAGGEKGPHSANSSIDKGLEGLEGSGRSIELRGERYQTCIHPKGVCFRLDATRRKGTPKGVQCSGCTRMGQKSPKIQVEIRVDTEVLKY